MPQSLVWPKPIWVSYKEKKKIWRSWFLFFIGYNDNIRLWVRLVRYRTGRKSPHCLIKECPFRYLQKAIMNLDYEQYKVYITMQLFFYSLGNKCRIQWSLFSLRDCDGLHWGTIITYHSLLLAVLGIRDIFGSGSSDPYLWLTDPGGRKTY